jgi:glycosyltransferase involved in cell wall biosynthesis
MEKLVSVIIPCFNAARWLREAIDSCLQQTYPRIEIIVIDDGSTDNCLEIIKSYEDKIIWETGPNRGGNRARNRGFALSKGEYIQYLDADDYMLPEKIERQVLFLEKTGADVVYGDWKYKRHLPDGTNFLQARNFSSGPKEDILESLLSDHWWVAPVALLFTRAAVDSCSGWDESLKGAQDRDFFISVVMNDPKVVYQPGCYSFYRKYGNTTVSSSNKTLLLESHFLVMEKAEVKLVQLDKLSNSYRQALAQGYLLKSRYYKYLDYSQHVWVLRKILFLCPEFKVEGSAAYNLIQRISGFLIAEIILRFTIQLTKKLKIIPKSFQKIFYPIRIVKGLAFSTRLQR